MIDRSLPTLLVFGCWTLIMVSQTYAARTVFQRTDAQASRRVLALHWVMSLTQAYAILHPAVVDATARAVGLALLALSLALLWWSIKHARGAGLGIAFSDALPNRVLQSGPYRVIRHPFYLSYILSWVATPFLSGWWLTAAIPILMTIVYVAAARAEEQQFSAGSLASDYEEYRARAAMLWPRFRP
jgi:protein-S-isoprenylcysteine O-methyltransferase Ste14